MATQQSVGAPGDGAAQQPPRSPWPMISIAEANRISLELTEPMKPVEKPIGELEGCILAQDVIAPEPVPTVPTSIMDGYAVVSSDGAGEFNIVAEARAGAASSVTVSPGNVAYITTGAPVPNGADAVVMVEETVKVSGTRVQIQKAASARQNIREVGSDLEKGEVVLKKGDRLGAAEVGLLATVGAVTANVFPKPEVAIMSTGDELAEPNAPSPLPAGTIRDSNRAMLIAACQEEGLAVRDMGIVSDDAAKLEAKVDECLRGGVRVLITSGGVSMGDKDLVKPLLERRGTIHFGRVLMKPGKPLTFATLSPSNDPSQTLLVFGLPGNPVSSLVTFHLCVIPVLRKLRGDPSPHLLRVRAKTVAPLPLDPVRPEYHRATLRWHDGQGCYTAHSTGGQRSSRLLSMRSANALLQLPQAKGMLPAGSEVAALVIGPLSMAAGGAAGGGSSTLAVPFPPVGGWGGGTQAFTYAGAEATPKIGVLTVSDRASRGEYQDVSGPNIVQVLKEYLKTECHYLCRMVPDEAGLIAAAIRSFASAGCTLVCTTGGTGPALRDVTPEAMTMVCDKMYDGFGEQMRRASLDAGVPTAILSRQSAGSLNKTLVINLPGKPGSIRTCLDAVFPAVPYCIDLLGGPFLEGNQDKVNVFRPGAK